MRVIREFLKWCVCDLLSIMRPDMRTRVSYSRIRNIGNIAFHFRLLPGDWLTDNRANQPHPPRVDPIAKTLPKSSNFIVIWGEARRVAFFLLLEWFSVSWWWEWVDHAQGHACASCTRHACSRESATCMQHTHTCNNNSTTTTCKRARRILAFFTYLHAQ